MNSFVLCPLLAYYESDVVYTTLLYFILFPKLKKKKKGKEIHFPLSFAPGKRPTSLLFIYLFIL